MIRADSAVFRRKLVYESVETRKNKKAGAERRLSCYTTNGAYFFFLAPPFFVAFLFFAAICSLHGEGVERRSNPPVDWSAAAGREHPTGSARRNFGAKLRQTGLFNQHVMQGYDPHDDRLVVPKLRNMSGIATRQS